LGGGGFRARQTLNPALGVPLPTINGEIRNWMYLAVGQRAVPFSELPSVKGRPCSAVRERSITGTFHLLVTVKQQSTRVGALHVFERLI